MTDPGTRALARELVEMRRRLERLELPSQGWARSVEESSLDFYDENGVLRASLGKQADGAYGIRYAEGDIPPAPTEPDVVVISDGVVAVTWDGRWEERYSHVGWRNVQIHLGDTATFTPDRDTQVGAIFSPRGGTVVAVTESDDDNPVYVRLVGMNDAGQTGDPSTAVLVDELDEDNLEEEEELEWEDGDGHTLTETDITAGTATFSLSHIPEEESVIAFVDGVHQKPSNYTVDYEAPSITWPLDGWEPAGARMSVQYPYFAGPEPAMTAALAYWPLDESSGLTAFDASSNERDLANGGATVGAAAIRPGAPSSYDFGGNTAHRLRRAYEPWMDVASFSLAGWIKPDVVSGLYAIMSRDGDTRGWTLYINGGKLDWYINAGDNLGVGAIAAGTVYHVAATYDSPTGEARLYIDGALDRAWSLGSGGINNTTSAMELIVGASYAGVATLNFPFDGKMSDLAYYGSVLSAEEVANLATGTVPPIGA